jgi:hypothetical protein
MMNYQSRIREIQSAFVMGYHDRETCIRMFEELLHDYKLLPKEEQLDRAITNENFLSLLKTAKDSSVSNTTAIQRFNPIKPRCPVCEKEVKALFNRVQGPDREFMAVEPPRCQECMMQWVQKEFGVTPGKSSAPQFVDHSNVSTMKPEELEFFAEYEKQMQDPQ